MYQEQKSMSRGEFLLEMDGLLGLRPGTLQGNEKLEELDNWDSTSLISLIVMAETNNGVSISPGEVVGCSTIADLLHLARVEGE